MVTIGATGAGGLMIKPLELTDQTMSLMTRSSASVVKAMTLAHYIASNHRWNSIFRDWIVSTDPQNNGFHHHNDISSGHNFEIGSQNGGFGCQNNVSGDWTTRGQC